LRDSVNITPKNLVDNLMTSVDLYRAGAPFRDDLTLLAFSINEDDEVARAKSSDDRVVPKI
jgi:serine phosphatase RsbU (regulator of sigma subunit)